MARSDDDLRRLLADLESDQVERKESLNGRDAKDRVYQAICAYANDLPGHSSSGVVFVGAADDGSPASLPITDALLLALSDMRGQGKLLPPPIMHVRKLVVGSAEVAVVEVEPSPSPPVRLDGQVWIRVGPRRAIATADEERRRAERRRSADLPYDARPLNGAVLSDLDLALFEREYLPAVREAAADFRALSERILTAVGVDRGGEAGTVRAAVP